MGVNNLPRVAAWRCTGRELNPGPLNLESNTLTTTPPSHPDANVHNHNLHLFQQNDEKTDNEEQYKPAETMTSFDPQICLTVFLIVSKPKESGPE